MKRLATLLLLASGSAHADTMPQLDFANPLLLSQVVWGALIFLVFYLLVSRWGLPKVGAVLEMRAQTIGADLEAARLSKSSADQAVAELNEARRRAIAQSQAEIAEASAAAKANAASRAKELGSWLDAQLAESEARISQDRTRALGSLQDVATETAQAVIARLTGLSAGPAAVQSTVRDLLAERSLTQPG